MLRTLHESLLRRAVRLSTSYQQSHLDLSMQIHLTQAKVIVSKKDGRYWLKVSGILQTGEAITGLLPWAADREEPKLDVTPEELGKYTLSEASFDNRGQLTDIR